MPKNQFQRMVFAFITVVITVHAFVFYNIYVLNGDTLRAFNYTSSVLTAVNKQGRIMMFGTMLPIWAVVLVEFAFFSQHLFIQPFVRRFFKLIFRKSL